jgi:hypothetical protein
LPDGGPTPARPAAARAALRRALRVFGHFWWDFLVGDTPELLVATLVIIAVVALCTKLISSNGGAWIALPVLVIVALVVSVGRGRRSS